MDKIVLTKEQLKEARRFIHKRGFIDECLVEEILDHFACKIEELMAKDHRLGFEDAMANAHKSFGYAGFGAIVKPFKEGVLQRYRALYWSFFREFLRSPINVMLLVAVGLACYKMYLLFDFHQFLWQGMNILSGILLLTAVAESLLLFWGTPKIFRNSFLIEAGKSPENSFFLIYWYASILMQDHPSISFWGINIIAALTAIASQHLLVHFYARRKTYRFAKDAVKQLIDRTSAA